MYIADLFFCFVQKYIYFRRKILRHEEYPSIINTVDSAHRMQKGLRHGNYSRSHRRADQR